MTSSVLAGRRRIDPAAKRLFQVSMRNDFLTPRGTPYKWQELTASVDRTVIGPAAPTVVPVSYGWQSVSARTGIPEQATDWREWTFARGQSFRSVLLHAELDGADPPSDPAGSGDDPLTAPADGAVSSTLDVSYPDLPRAPAVDLLLMVSWDVITFEMIATNLINTAELRTVGGFGELRRISGTWADLQFTDPGAVAVFRNSRMYGRHLGHGRVGDRASAVYSLQCLDCKLDVRSGPVTQRGRSSYWVTVQVDVETGDLLHAEMTEMIVATLTGPDGERVPVQKRRLVRMWAGCGDPAEEEPVPVAGSVDPAALAEAAGLAERVSRYVQRQTATLGSLPQGAADLAVMGFRSMVGADSADVYRRVRALRGDLVAMSQGGTEATASLRRALPEHRRYLEGLLAFGQIAVDEATRLGVRDEPGRKALHDYMERVRGDLTRLLSLLERLEVAGSG
ncbi:hypothetical protein GCM10011608_01720 [Micromonospora sonchi]|uniref:Uncharacterized protein n=1 Tax=Micromonospora sonchi TaxID=1763543 RepID=A0A917TF21_9ACTN|nr:hypothetical protein [Micromonospora sonchi]GGM20768.1 hypothetical protein GCM10011608_01720 [Micromonospora sonchi]